MASLIRALAICCSILLAATPVRAETSPNPSFEEWINDLETEAVGSGLSPSTVQDALENATLDERVVALDQKQPETTITFDSYAKHIITSERVGRGQELLREQDTVLNDISRRFGVPPEIIVALWGIESHFGKNSGDYSVINSLVTLAYEGRRADFFRKELLNALRIIEQEHISAPALRGSWAGAMGQCQFMPSTYLNYAVDFSNTGQRDIWNNTPDVLASIANYLAAEGWKRDSTWGQEVSVEQAVPAEDIGPDSKRTFREWGELGVHMPDGSRLPDVEEPAYLLQPDGPDGRSFLVFSNFRALMRWNRSTYFATTVGLLADRIRQ